MRFLVILFPWLELATLIQLGIETSAITALAWVFLTFVLGVLLLQQQGQGLLRQLQHGRTLGPELLVDEMALGFSGLLLMIPGLLTDALALLVMIGPLRRRIVGLWRPGSTRPDQSGADVQQPHTIEGEYRRVDSPEDR